MGRKRVCQQCRAPLPKFGPTGMKKRIDTLFCNDCVKAREYDLQRAWIAGNIEGTRAYKRNWMKNWRAKQKEARCQELITKGTIGITSD